MDESKPDLLQRLKNLQLSNSEKPGSIPDFDRIVGCLEDMLVDPSFAELQNSFLDAHWTTFEDNEECKLEYMDIFFNYTKTMENHIVTYLRSNCPGFSMETFIKELIRRKNELDGEVFEILFTLTDFLAFREMFMDYRRMKMLKDFDLGSAVTVTPIGNTAEEPKKNEMDSEDIITTSHT